MNRNTNGNKKILVLAANPVDTPRMRFDREIRDIEEGLRRSRQRDRFDLEPRLAVRYKDLRRALLDIEPQIVHFSGHGGTDGLKLEGPDGKAATVPPAALSDLFRLCAGHVECVILNACYTAVQADAISEHIENVVGMLDKIPDKAALEFSVGFYDALGAGETVERAFQFGCNAIQFAFRDFPAHYIPILKTR
jgi:hypothetical protein